MSSESILATLLNRGWFTIYVAGSERVMGHNTHGIHTIAQAAKREGLNRH